MPTERVQRQIDRLLDQVEEAVAGRDWQLVGELCDSVLRLDHDNGDARTFLEAAGHDTGIGVAAAPSERTEPRPEADVPTSFDAGRYQVKEFLGEGGKKRVYLAHDTTLDRDVAFALIKTEGFDRTAKERITREAQAMGRLGTHPNIVTVFDLGEHDDGSPYMVTELMAGGDVEDLLNGAGDQRLPLEQALEITRSVCRGLEFAHSQGIVHRDLKPGNVWLTEDRTAKIGDFGLAVMTDRTRLTREGMMVGTVSYMPPEQATGGDITPRADLYSLGAMLYEMVTGRPPFMGDDEIAIIGQHINTPPVAPQWHRPEISAQLDSLITRLLSKNPAERSESATDVLAALDAIDLASLPSPLAGESQGEGDGPQAGSLDSMAGGVFVGRHREMDQLKAALENALSGRGGMVTIVGEPGIGKTRTSLELETYAGLRNAQVLWGRCYEGGGAPPYWPWVQAIRSYVSTREPEELRREMGSTASVISEIVVDVKERLPGVEPPPPIDDPESARFRLFDSIATFLKNAGQTQPFMLVLDDLHWADKPSLLLLEFVARELSSSRILLVGAYRDMELNRRHPLSVTLGDLTRERLFERVLLRGLTREDVARFIEIAAGVVPPRGLVDAVHTQTEGNPLFVTETVRLLIQEGEFTPDQPPRSDSSWNIRIPEGVREVIGRRLDRLSERCNEVLTVAAVIGRQFTLDQLRAVLNFDDGESRQPITETQLLDVVDESLSARVIEELPDRVGLYQFTHAVVEETLSAEFSLTRRVRIHALIARAFEEMYGKEADGNAPELVEHFAAAETVLGSERLVHYSILAGQEALDAYANEDALRYLERAESATSRDEPNRERARILHLLGQARVSTADALSMQAAWDTLVRAHDMYLSLGMKEASVQPLLTGIPFQHVSGAKPVLEKALDLLPDSSSEHGWLLARFAITVGSETGDKDSSRKALRRAIEIGEAVGDVDLVTRAYAHIAQSFDDEFDPLNAIEAAESAIAIGEEHSSQELNTTGRANGVLARSYSRFGRMEKAKPHFDGLIENVERFRFRALMASWRVTQAKWSRMEGDFARSQELVEEYAAIAPVEASADWFRVVATYDTGNLEEADQLLSKAMDEWESVHFYGGNVPMIATLAPLVGHRAVFDRYEEMLRTARGMAGNPLFGDQQLSRAIAIGMLAVANGDRDEASVQRAMIEPYAGMASPDQLIVHDRALGHIQHLLGELDEAASYFEAARNLSRSAGWKRELAIVLAFEAETLVQRDAPGDSAKAVELQDEAIAIAQELGMKPLLERVLAQREILNA